VQYVLDEKYRGIRLRLNGEEIMSCVAVLDHSYQSYVGYLPWNWTRLDDSASGSSFFQIYNTAVSDSSPIPTNAYINPILNRRLTILNHDFQVGKFSREN